MVNHGTQALGLANPLQHLAILTPFGVVVDIEIELAVLGGTDELVAIFHQAVGRSPELQDVAAFVVTVVARVGVVLVAAVGTDLYVYITVVDKGQLIGIAVQVADKGMSVDAVESTLNL